MAKHKEEKTNVMRILDQKKIPYTAHTYEESESPLGDREYGLHIAEKLGQTVEQVYKTLVARGASGQIYVFCIPVAENLDLKKAAKAVGEKSVEHEEAVPHGFPQRGGKLPAGFCQRGKDRLSDRGGAACAVEPDRRGDRRRDRELKESTHEQQNLCQGRQRE